MATESELYSIWNRVLKIFEEKLDNHVYSVFFKDSYIHSIKKDTMVIVWNSRSACTFIESKYHTDIVEVVNEVTGSIYEIKHFCEDDLPKIDNVLVKKEAKTFFQDSKLNSKYTFDTFVLGLSNKEAAQNSLIVGSNPGKMFNPLFIYSDSGLGKTHLLHAIGNYAKSTSPRTNVLIITTEQLVDEYVKSARGDEDVNELKDFIKKTDLLLIDDIQFLANKPKTEEFFFPIFNYLISNDKQIVITSDKKPADLNGLDQRLVTRFAQGLSVNIAKPDKQTCIDIIKQKIKEDNIQLEFDDVALEFIADNFSSSVRELEGALVKILSFSITIEHTTKVDLKYAIRAVQGLYDANELEDQLSEKKIINVVAEYYNLTSQQLLGNSRVKAISQARHVAMYLLKEMLELTNAKIGYLFGGKDHTSVMFAIQKVEKMCKTDPQTQAVISKLKAKCKG